MKKLFLALGLVVSFAPAFAAFEPGACYVYPSGVKVCPPPGCVAWPSGISCPRLK